MEHRKIVLIICDGFGIRKDTESNAILSASTPNFDNLWENYPSAVLQASGIAIGLPEGQMGTSEANHLTIGSGRIIYQNLVKINLAVENRELEKNPVVIDVCKHARNNKSALHILGMASDGGVHGHIKHLKGLVETAKSLKVEKVFLHLFTDGRDVPPKSALAYIEDLENFLKKCGDGKISSIGGRYWGMDRDNNLDRVEKHFLVMHKGSETKFNSAREIIEQNYLRGKTDEFIEPASIELGEESGLIKEDDAVIFANFRSDRAKELTKMIVSEGISNLKFATMTRYDDELQVPVIFPPEEIKNSLSEVIAENGLKQLKITETEKFTHLTFFFNAQKYEPVPGEDRVMIPSNKDVKTHDEKPEMKAVEIADGVISAMKDEKYDFIAVNITNCDMVGHSGNFPAIVKAVQAVDKAVGKIIASRGNYDLIVTADHGNAEETYDRRADQPMTAHTLNPVPFFIVSEKFSKLKHKKGNLSDIAPTILNILGLKTPKEMSGKSLV